MHVSGSEPLQLHVAIYNTTRLKNRTYNALHCIMLHCICCMRCIHYIHYLTLPYFTLRYIMFFCITLHYTTLHYTTLHYHIAFHYIASLCIHTHIHTCLPIYIYSMHAYTCIYANIYSGIVLLLVSDQWPLAGDALLRRLLHLRGPEELAPLHFQGGGAQGAAENACGPLKGTAVIFPENLTSSGCRIKIWLLCGLGYR